MDRILIIRYNFDRIITVRSKKIKKGKILKVKVGYNPNSSSIGTLLKAFPCALFGSTILFNIVAGIIFSRKLKSEVKDKPGKK